MMEGGFGEMGLVVEGDADMGKAGELGMDVDNLAEDMGKLDISIDVDQDAIPSLSLSELPVAVKEKIRALRKNQVDIFEVEREFYKDLHLLEMNYENKYKALYDKVRRKGVAWILTESLQRRELIVGILEPTDGEKNFQIGALDAIQTAHEIENKTEEEQIKGVPMFWATVLQSVSPVAVLLEKQDLPILKYLQDIKCVNTLDPWGFTLCFYFAPNEFFSNSMLTKTYTLRAEPNTENPMSFDGSEIVGCEGCSIDWKPGKDATMTVVEKKQKHKRTGNIRTLTTTEKVASFFHFFKPPVVADAEEDMQDEAVEALNTDFEIGEAIRDRVIPRAILYYTGEANENDSEFDSTESEGETESSEEEDIGEHGDQPL